MFSTVGNEKLLIFAVENTFLFYKYIFTPLSFLYMFVNVCL